MSTSHKLFVLDMPYNQLTVAMLKPIAKSHNIKGYYKMRKLDLYNEVIKKTDLE